MMIDKVPRWLMLARIAEIEIWDDKHERILWSVSAPWFRSSEKRDLMDLYKH